MEALRLSKARWRTYWLAVVLCCGGALFGYDSGVIGKLLGSHLRGLSRRAYVHRILTVHT